MPEESARLSLSGPLEDVHIVELTTMVAGPYAGQQLGDLGADVVKVEQPGDGELARRLEPTQNGESFYYLTCNRNKRSLALDITADDGRAAFLDVVEKADVLLENFQPAFTDRYDIDYESVRERKPDIIYCSISAFGETGPYREYPGIDTTVQAMSGAMSMTQTDDSQPMRSGVPMNDVFAALQAVQAILAALRQRDRTGEGQHLDISLLDTGLAGLTTRATYGFMTGDPYPPFGRRHNYFAPEGVYEVADGDVQLSVITDRHWRRFCQAIDAPDLLADERFESTASRVANSAELDSRLMECLAEWQVDEIVSKLRKNGVAAAQINDTRSVWDDPHVQAREMQLEYEHPTAGTVETLGFPVKYSKFSPEIDRHPPHLGEHSQEILRTAGYSDTDIAQLLEAEIIDTSTTK